MSGDLLREQAETLTAELSRIRRRLFALSSDDPTARLTLAQFRVCILLSDGPLAMSAISRELGISRSAVTQIANRLERDGLVQRVAQEDDRRVRMLRLTPRAVRMMRRRREKRVERVLKVLEALDAEEREAILDVLHRLAVASLRAGPHPSDSRPLREEASRAEGL